MKLNDHQDLIFNSYPYIIPGRRAMFNKVGAPLSERGISGLYTDFSFWLYRLEHASFYHIEEP